ncbi:MD-2-related lipid-recognition protein-like [Zerene cesonia]|uniref:MD-2-related lipid-recognition protein-like n=1 Tax=Zerene cesonia TaxID=33412 RepID=UPI0018E55424|nr:MD-2-related lipid-recognition protein-like [Zerene cesonia]
MVKYLVFLALFAFAAGDLADFKKCSESPDDMCVINEVRVTPCKKASSCRLKLGTISSISFDMTPGFSASKLKTGLFWASNNGDVPFPDLFEADACQYTGCPVEAGKQQTFDYSLRLGKKLPSGKYLFKFKVWDEQNPNMICCFKTNVELRK